MKLQKLIIENFRQFHGTQEIVFATGRDKNVTLIHAENGFGKTALLNAILWGFYGHDSLTGDLPKKESIIHEALALKPDADSDTEARVTLLFEDRGDTYTLVRSLNLSQQQDYARKTEVELVVNRDGQTYRDNGSLAQRKIDALMPPGISSCLFFNGEYIDHLAMEESAHAITEAIYQMLGLQLLRRTIEDLGNQSVRGRLVSELRDKTDSNTKDLIDQQSSLEAKLADFRQRLEACCDNQAAVAEEIKQIDARLAANQETRDLQSQRARLEAERASLEKRLGELNTRIAALIAEEGYILFSSDLVTRGKAITQRLREEGKIPARVLNVFIEDILRMGRCICGCEIKEGSESFEKVKQLLTIAGDQHFNNAVGALDNAIGVIEGAVERTRTLFRQMTAEKVEMSTRHDRISDLLDEISQKLGDKEGEEIHKLEEKRQSQILRLRELDREHGALEKEIKDTEIQHDQIRRQIAAAQQQDAAAALTQRRLSLLEETISLLQNILAMEMEDVRKVLSKEINEQFDKIVDRRYWVELSEDFTLSLRKRLDLDDGESMDIDVAHSQGQRQVTSLVFIASLVALARRRDEIPTILRGVEGGEYPIVMDSPFGHLGNAFRAGVARWIPTLAPQVIILVSSSQYRGAVEEQLSASKRIGRRYVLCYHGPSKKQEAETELQISGTTYTVYEESRIEFTEIREIG